MTKQEAIQRKSEIEKKLPELDKIINASDITLEERFWQLMNGCVIYTEKQSPRSIFWMKNGEVWFELENSTLWCSWGNVWRVFENEYSMDYNNIQYFIKNQVENRFKMQGVTPFALYKPLILPVENRFKMQGVTPLCKKSLKRKVVENRFKMRGVTPKKY